MTQAKGAAAGGSGSPGKRPGPRGSDPKSGSPPDVRIWADHSGSLRMIEYGCVDWYMYEPEASPPSDPGRQASAAAVATTAAGH